MKRIIKSSFLCVMTIFAAPVYAQEFPSKPIRWIVGFPPGGPQDVRSRVIGAELGNALKGSVIVENKPGAGGNIAMMEIAKAAPDGHTIGLGYVVTHAIGPQLMKASTFDPARDHQFIAPLTIYTSTMLVSPSFPAKNAGDVVAYAKSNPGKVTYGSGGVGSSAHLAGAGLEGLTGTSMLHVPFQGTAPMVTALMSDQITFVFASLSSALGPMKSGKLKALAVTSPTRSSFVPDIPTMTESGVPGFSESMSDQWTAVFSPAAVRRPVADRLRGGVSAAMRSESVKEKMQSFAEEPWNMTPERFPAFLKTDIAKWGQVIKAAKIQPE